MLSVRLRAAMYLFPCSLGFYILIVIVSLRKIEKNCSFWKCELKPSGHACKISETICYQFCRKESTLFTTKTRFSMLFARILATLLAGILRW